MVILYEPFSVGDTIKVLAFEGKVMTIDLRHTVLLKDGDTVFMPNSVLTTNPIVKLGSPNAVPPKL
jgi:small-conductance mechanosensitive channel